MDTGADTNIFKPNLLPYPIVNLEKPAIYNSLAGQTTITQKIVTPIPIEFKREGTVDWKLFQLSSGIYDGIMSIGTIHGLGIQLDLDNKFAYTSYKYKIPFISYDIPIKFFNVETVEPITSVFTEIDNKTSTNELNSEEKLKLKDLLNENKNLFYTEGESLSCTSEVQHEIKLIDNRPIYSKIYRYPQVHEEEIRKQISDMLESGIIRESNSPYNSPLWIVPKKLDSSSIQKWRIVIDYRKLNEVTVDDKFPIPNIDQILDRLGRAQYFTTLDLAKGFHQVLVNENDRQKTAFSTPYGHYEYIRMPFGLKKCPFHFSTINEFRS